ncbi:isochorismatase [Brevundimonas intermedia]|uniref:Isochorismatase n=1 Tax=Brevundimonas intermedia TaxID=74315 RepID=A0ABQ5T8I1_9CAUL|nr:cysteine hydrolase family protein [Brevundimonas intermedia]GLK47668.1 isochorismatase [Brevundimonas intermedia]
MIDSLFIETDLPPTLWDLAGVGYAPPDLSGSTLLLIDLQNEYVSGPLALPHAADAIGRATALLLAFRAQGGQVVHVAHAGAAGGVFDRADYRGQIVTSVAPREGEAVVEKTAPNAFVGTDLEARIAPDRPLVIAGFMTHNCVASTARAAFERGFQVIVAHDACATRPLPDLDGGVLPAKALHQATLIGLADRHIHARTVKALVNRRAEA